MTYCAMTVQCAYKPTHAVVRLQSREQSRVHYRERFPHGVIGCRRQDALPVKFAAVQVRQGKTGQIRDAGIERAASSILAPMLV